MITVVGSAVVDFTALLPHLPKLGETVMGFHPLKISAGGKGGNQAAAACKAGAKVNMVTKLGQDDFSKIITAAYDEMGIHYDHIIFSKDVATGTAPVLVDENTGNNYVVVIPGGNLALTAADIDTAEDLIAASDVVILQLEISPEANLRAAQLAHKHHVPVMLNPAPYSPMSDELVSLADYVTPNETEASYWSGVEVVDDESAVKAAEIIKSKGAKNVIITLGKRGSLISADGETFFQDSFKVNAIDATGAGDAFNGGFARAIEKGYNLREAARFATAVSALSVTKAGATPSMPLESEVMEFLEKQN